MPTRSTPLYLGDELRAQAERAADAAGRSLSAWVREAIEARLAHDAKIAAGVAAVRDFERDRGPIPSDIEALARREFEDAGVIPRRSA
ncbi:MAG: hypothetical protein ACRDTX_22905 [Pseudonocardiaceae bacterium]